MQSISYIYSRLLKKIRGVAISKSAIHHTSRVHSGSTVINSTMSKHSFCGYDCTLIDCDIGPFCSIASDVTIGGPSHPLTHVSTSPAFLSHKDSIRQKYAHHLYDWHRRTIIGSDVWIGQSVLVKSGITIGHGAAIGMGSVVTKDIPPYAVVAGNPARLIRMRFEPRIVDALLRMQWWNYSDEELKRIGPVFDDPERMLKQEGLL